MKTLQIVAYEKFLPHIYETSEAINPGRNRYLVYGASDHDDLKLDNKEAVRVQSGNLKVDAQIQSDVAWCDAVFVHPLERRSKPVVDLMMPEQVLVWCVMGADYYLHAPEGANELLLERTNRVVKELNARKGLVNKIKASLPEAARKRFKSHKDRNAVRRMMPRVDYFTLDDYGVRFDLPGFRAQTLNTYLYYTLETSLNADAGVIDGQDILIGNSATATNNHFDLFEQMKTLDLTGRRIMLPLNYGDMAYGDAVERRAIELFGQDHVVAFRDWMPIEKYNAAVSTCGTVFMNHRRMQAMGNLCSMMLRGAKVYIRREQPYNRFFESLGVVMGKIDDHPFDMSVFAPLSADEKQRNHEAIANYWNKAAVVKRNSLIFKEVEAEVARRRAGAS